MLKIVGILLAYPLLFIAWILVKTATVLCNLAELIACGQKARHWETRFYWRNDEENNQDSSSIRN